MSPHDIKAILANKGFTLRDIADEFKISVPGVHYVVYGRNHSKRIESRIITITGLPDYKLWPHWYSKASRAA